MKGLRVILVALVGWTMVAVAAEATPFTAPIGDQGYLASPWTPSTTLGAVDNAQALVPVGLEESVRGRLLDVAFSAIDRSQLDNPVDQLALDLGALTIDARGTRVVPGPVLALLGVGLVGMGFTLWRQHGGIRS